jgi:basic membrane lipoprotein Med (substrate-binding protein (PBP1-ABC) superfamily)
VEALLTYADGHRDGQTNGEMDGQNKNRIQYQSKIRFWGGIMLPATVTFTEVFTYGAKYWCPIRTKFGFSRQIFIRILYIKFHGHPSSGICVDTCGQTDKETYMTKVKGVLRDYANAPNNIFHYCNIVVHTHINLKWRKRSKASAKLINIDNHS